MNPNGYVHEMITTVAASGVSTASRKPTTENSWFPGYDSTFCYSDCEYSYNVAFLSYGWQILNCSRCSAHIGWKFTTQDHKLKPKKFWGITRKAIAPTIDQTTGQLVTQLLVALLAECR